MENNIEEQEGKAKKQESSVSYQEKGYAFGQAVQIASEDLKRSGLLVSSGASNTQFKMRVKRAYKLILEARQEIREDEAV